MKLFTRTKIGNMTLKNRIIMCPMGNKTDPDGGVQERNIDYFEERAKGGCAAIFTGAFMCTEEFETRGCNVLYNFSHVDRLNLLVDKVHAHDCKLVVQLTAGLGRMGYTDPTRPPYSASDTETFYFKGVYCKPFTVEQIRYMVKAMGNSAMLAKRAGADAVELHCYGGYLIDQFQTALWNHRTDEYGGSLENRMRFTMEIIKEVQKTCGPDFPIIVKFCVTHDMGDAPGYHDMAEGLEMAKMYEAAGVAALHVDVGCYDAWYKAITTCYNKEGHQLFAARAVKKAVSIPVITQGKLFDPVKAEAVLEDGDADIVGLGHQMLTDPYWPQKVKEGRVPSGRAGSRGRRPCWPPATAAACFWRRPTASAPWTSAPYPRESTGIRCRWRPPWPCGPSWTSWRTMPCRSGCGWSAIRSRRRRSTAGPGTSGTRRARTSGCKERRSGTFPAPAFVTLRFFCHSF